MLCTLNYFINFTLQEEDYKAMSVTIQFSKLLSADATPLIIPFYHVDGKPELVAADSLSEVAGRFIAGVLAVQPDHGFSGKGGTSVNLYFPEGSPEGARPVVLYGLGEKKDFDAQQAEILGGKLCALLAGMKVQTAALAGEDMDLAAHFLVGFTLRSYVFDRYKSKAGSGDEAAAAFDSLTFCGYDFEIVQEEYRGFAPVLAGIVCARDLVNEAPNALYPESYAALIAAELKPLGVEVEILDDKKMKKLGMGGIMAVGQGSDRPPRMVIMRWRGAGVSKKQAPLALVGKGVTFDTGGISLKPGPGMDEMKMDMGGSAAVVGTLKALAMRKAPAHVVGIVGLAENMPSSKAYRPGDIITSYAGKTIEVLNTDAEGRLVLADALSYVQEQYDPCAVIDLATLTGAMMIALGNEYCGTFANDDGLWAQLDDAASSAHEKIWRMPLDEVWSKEMLSAVADLRNIGKSRFAGSCTAAAFLEHFIDDGRKWAHMDIAGTAWIKEDKPIVPKFGTGYGVRTLYQLVQLSYETAQDS